MNQTVFITGASRGIGKAIAREYARQGYDLILTCLTNIDALQQLANELTDTYPISCRIFQADMGNFDDVKNIFFLHIHNGLSSFYNISRLPRLSRIKP